MRHRIVAALIGSVAALVLTTSAVGQPHMRPDDDKTPATCDGKTLVHHLKRGRAIIKQGYDLNRIPDPTPMKASEKRALRGHKFCIVDEQRHRISTFRDRKADKYHEVLAASTWPTPEACCGVSSSTLDAIASCESGGDPSAVDASGTYYGLFQFDMGTWASVGGSGSPAAASVDEQYYRAAKLYASRGSSPWPNCG